MVLNNPLFVARNSRSGAYQIEQSLRFDGSSYLSWTPSSAGNRRTSTFSVWFKPTTVGGEIVLLSATGYTKIALDSGGLDHIWFQDYDGSVRFRLETSASFRDPSAWYHVIGVVDTTNATSSDRIRIYVNGERLSAFGTNTQPSQNFDTDWANTVEHKIGSDPNPFYFRGYMAECHFIDGTAVTDATDFGEYDDNGVWRPIEYTGSYGTNGFYLKFDPSATNGIGHDHSGNGNNFTASGFTTSGAGTDVMSDTPTTNYATFNPVAPSALALSEGNLSLSFTNSGSETHSVPVTMGATSGKFYVEFKYTYSTSGASTGAGVFDLGTETDLEGYVSGWSRIIYDQRGVARKDNSNVATGLDTTYTTGDILGIAVDCDNGQVRFYVNGTLQHTETGLSYSAYGFHFEPNIGGSNNACTVAFNGGQRAFEQTVPSGYKALNTSNLSAPDIKDGSVYFTTLAYSGTSTTDSKVIEDSQGNDWAPDFVWLKKRNSGANHMVYDRVRGASKSLRTNTYLAEVTGATNGDLTAFTSTGFTLDSGNDVNASGNTYVAWNWLANGSGSSNTAGSITSTVSANPTAGFSIVSYTGTNSSATVGHGLGVELAMYIVKDRDNGNNWTVYHQYLGNTTCLFLDTNAAQQTASSTYWNNTSPTSTTFSIGNNARTGAARDYIAYCFAEVEGYSKFGSYTGNGNLDGVFNFCGFKPAWLLVKRTNTTANWHLVDSTRSPYNLVNAIFLPDLSDQESTYTNGGVDFVSNGFKIRSTGQAFNNSGDSYIFAAFAEHPFGGSGVSPATAR